jgi:hypothetical protein
METELLEDFLTDYRHGDMSLIDMRLGIRRFCRQYRELGFGTSFLNESHSARWLVPWRDWYFARGRRPNTLFCALGRARRWTEFLFSRGVLDDDAFLYLDRMAFLRKEKAPPHLDVNLQRPIAVYAKEMAARYRPQSTNIYSRVLHDFNRFQNAWDGRQEEWKRLQDETLILAWLASHGRRIDEVNLRGNPKNP